MKNFSAAVKENRVLRSPSQDDLLANLGHSLEHSSMSGHANVNNNDGDCDDDRLTGINSLVE